MNKTNALPSFFIDNSDSDKYEEVIDFYISWTLRCAIDEYKFTSPKVHQLSKQILSKLVSDGFDYFENKTITEVKVWKQWQYIDLSVEVYVNEILVEVLIIETKMYSKIRENQLNSYKKTAKKYYEDKFDITKIRFVLIRPDEELTDIDKNKLEDYQYKILDLLIPNNAEKTGNALFDEFWFNWSADVIESKQRVSSKS